MYLTTRKETDKEALAGEGQLSLHVLEDELSLDFVPLVPDLPNLNPDPGAYSLPREVLGWS
jgi:hypothetical protein